MKRKFVLRLLAAVMAVSLTATSVPSGLLSTVETVYAASASDGATLTTNDFSTTAATISIKKGTNSKFYGLIKHGTGSSDDVTFTGNTGTTGNAFEIKDGLNANTAYDVYVADDASKTNAKFLCTVTTDKISLADTSVAKITKVDLNDDGKEDTLSSDKVIFNGKAQEPAVLEVTVPKDTDPTDTETLTYSQIKSNFDITYKNNINAGAYDGTNAPTIVLTAKKNSKYSDEVSLTATFTIDQFTMKDTNTQIKIDGAVYGPSNIKSFPYDGTGQDSVLQGIEVSVDLDGDNVYETKLKRNTDYVINFGTQQTDTSNATSGDTNGLNATTDQGTVTLKFDGTATGNYKATAPLSAQFNITQSTPDTPTAPTVTAAGSQSIKIDTSDEDQRYTYQYMILTEDDLKKAIVWPDAGMIESPAVDSSVTKKASYITVTTAADNTTTVAAKDSAGSAVADVTVTGAGSNVLRMDGTTDLVLNSSTTYYVVRRIVNSINVKGSYTSAKTSVTTKKVELKAVVKSTNHADSISGDNNAKLSTSPKNYDKIYNAEDQDDVNVILYTQTGQGGQSLKEGVDYTIEYYNVPTGKTGETWAKSTANGRKGDKKSAGTVYVWAVANDVNYSGELLIGYYVISKRDITLDVESTSKDYDGTTDVYGLKATGTYKTDTVTVTGLADVALDKVVGTWGISDVDGNTGLHAVDETTYSENAANYNITYNVHDAKVTINKATVKITGSNITIAYGQKFDLDIKTNVLDVTKVLKYELNYKTGTTVATNLDLTQAADGTTGAQIATLQLKDYATISKATDIKVIASFTNVTDTDNYVVDKTSAEFTVTITPANLQVGFENDTDDDGVITVPSYTRRETVKNTIETAGAETVTSSDDANKHVGIASTPSKSARKGQLDTYNTTATAFYFDTTGSTKANIVYKYYKADGVTELYDIPTADGTYIVKAYLAANSKFAGNVIGTDGSDTSKYSGTIKLVIGGGKTSSSTGSSEGVADYYENADDGKVYDKNDQLVTNQVVNLDGTDKYVGSDGKVVTGKVLVDDAATGNTYAIAKDGSLIKNTKTTIGGKDYVTDANGAILKDQLATTPSGNTVYVGKDGAVVKNKVVTVGKAKYYANASGRIVKNGFFTTKAGNTVYATASGKLKYGKVFTVGKYKYFAKKSGVIAKSGIFETPSGNKVRATKTGKLYVSTTFTYKGVTYKASKNGVLKVVK